MPAKESLSLLNYGFRFFETHRLYDGGATLSDKGLEGEREPGAGTGESAVCHYST